MVAADQLRLQWIDPWIGKDRKAEDLIPSEELVIGRVEQDGLRCLLARRVVLVQHLTNTAEQLDLQIHLVIFVAAQDNTADPRATCDREEAHDPGQRFRW